MKNPKTTHSFYFHYLIFCSFCGYNIALLIAAKYLTSAYILAPQSLLLTVVIDPRLLALVLATVFSAAARFIVNNFYDAGKIVLIDSKSTFWNTSFH